MSSGDTHRLCEYRKMDTNSCRKTTTPRDSRDVLDWIGCNRTRYISPFTRANAKRGSVSRCTCFNIDGVAKVIEDADCRMCTSALYVSAAAVMDNGQWNGQGSGSTGGVAKGRSEECEEWMVGMTNKSFISEYLCTYMLRQ